MTGQNGRFFSGEKAPLQPREILKSWITTSQLFVIPLFQAKSGTVERGEL
jgi:hypothetical protein